MKRITDCSTEDLYKRFMERFKYTTKIHEKGYGGLRYRVGFICQHANKEFVHSKAYVLLDKYIIPLPPTLLTENRVEASGTKLEDFIPPKFRKHINTIYIHNYTLQNGRITTESLQIYDCTRIMW